MVPQDYQELSRRRALRARKLAEVHSEAEHVLNFYGHLAEFQSAIYPTIDGRDSLLEARGKLLDLVRRCGTELLRAAADELTEPGLWQALEKVWSQQPLAGGEEFFARVLLQPYATKYGRTDLPTERTTACPHCGQPPQLGLLRQQGHGLALSLGCSLCCGQWSFTRGQCPGCLQARENDLVFYQTPKLPQIRLQACESCRQYLHLIDLTNDPEAIPEVDELSALILDVWASQNGYQKLQKNLAGI